MTQKFLRIAILAVTTPAISLPAVAATSEWKIDPAHSSAQFAVRHLAISTIRGAFTKVSGTVQLDDQDVTKSSVDVTIDADSVDTRVRTAIRISAASVFLMLRNIPSSRLNQKKLSRQAPVT